MLRIKPSPCYLHKLECRTIVVHLLIVNVSFIVPSYSDHEYYQRLQHQKKENAHNILLVDDEPDTLFTYKTFLLDIEGYNLDAFTDSQKALQHFAQVNPSYYDLVVMDIMMSGLDGLQLYYRIKAINPDIKVLFVSALDAAKEMVSVLPSVKIEDVIQKPVNQEQHNMPA